MFSLVLECAARGKEQLVCDLWECGTAGIIEEEVPGDGIQLRAFFEDDVPEEDLRARFAAHGARWEHEETVDWVAGWRESWEPLTVGSRFFVVPAWREEATPAGRLRLEIDPGMAFGTGAHPTTQLSLEALERHLRPEDLVFDLGTGSGILARGAALLGARRIAACDIDPDAVAVAREQSRRAGLDVLLVIGSARSVRPRSVDLLVANINAETLAGLGAEIAGMLASGGRAVLSGFRGQERRRLERVFCGAGLVVIEAVEREGWCALVLASTTA